jgi:predicted RNase H-like HicB family nuclease
MANEKGIKVRLWREGKNVIVRSDALHITTYGKDTRQALGNFKEALALALDAMTSENVSMNKTLPFEFELGAQYGRTTAKDKAVATC